MDIYEEVYEKLSTLQWLLQRYKTEKIQKNDTFTDKSSGQGRVIAVLKMQSDITTKDLSYILGIRQQSLNELLKKLEKNGYVERVPSKEDGRVLLVRLTDKGKDIPETDHDYSNVFKELDEEELKKFSNSLDKVIASLQEEAGDIFDDNFYDWMKNAREKMTQDQFEEMMAMRHAVFNKFRFGIGGYDMSDKENNNKGFGFGFFGRGKAPEGMPGAERFDPDYDGPVPNRMGFPFGFPLRKTKKEESDTNKESEASTSEEVKKDENLSNEEK